MSEVNVIAAYENYDRILRSFSSEMQTFKEGMDGELSDVARTVNALSASWMGEAYRNFAREASGHTDRIVRELDRVSALCEVLEEKSIQIQRAIALLRGEG